jgi:GDYXXLXY protein
MNHNVLLAGALTIPLLGFGYSWHTTHQLAQQGEEWLIPVQGYDPRDLLRGHYVQYQYDWPVEKKATADGAEEDPSPMSDISYASAICIEGKAPNIMRASIANENYAPENSGGKANQPTQKCTIIARATLGTREEIRGLQSGILYVSQANGKALEGKLMDRTLQGLIRVKIRDDGVMRPVAMEFRARPPEARDAQR